MTKALSTLKIKNLELKGWKVGSAQDFLGLSKKELAKIKKRLILHKLIQKSDSKILAVL